MMKSGGLGYMVGDEGSGGVMGKVLVNGMLKGSLGVWVKNKYVGWWGLDYGSIINKV